MDVSSLLKIPPSNTKISKYRWVTAIALLAALALSPPLAQKGAAASSPPRTIALDPGHGGTDTGARGPAGTLEKNVALALARHLADRLSAQFRVRLTRTGDYAVALAERTAVANHANADLFISLHTGAGFLHHENRIDIWYLKKVAAGPPKAEPSRSGAVAWEALQVPHIEAGTRLAGHIRNRLAGMANSPAPETGGAPLAVLQGAKMPALLIEAGYLTHPATEQRLADPAHLRDLAARMARGINDYFADPAARPATDLKQ